jgi:hypothetical protein
MVSVFERAGKKKKRRKKTPQIMQQGTEHGLKNRHCPKLRHLKKKGRNNWLHHIPLLSSPSCFPIKKRKKRKKTQHPECISTPSHTTKRLLFARTLFSRDTTRIPFPNQKHVHPVFFLFITRGRNRKEAKTCPLSTIKQKKKKGIERQIACSGPS